MKNKFIDSEIWKLTFGGAFQRSGIYISGMNDGKKTKFRNQLKTKIEELTMQYESEVEEVRHLGNIRELIRASESEVLKDGKLRFGIAQKLFNLYLKYQWCRGKIVEPPHCPVDRIVLSAFSRSKVVNWTQIMNEEEYMAQIDNLKMLATANQQTLAIWELETFNRR